MPYGRYRRTAARRAGGYSAVNRQRVTERRAAGLVLTGDTYTIKEEIKAAGGLWDADSRGWAMPDVETFNQFAARIGALCHRSTHAAAVNACLSRASSQTQRGTLVQPTSNKCGSCESLIAVEFGVSVGGYFVGETDDHNYECCPRCEHAFSVA